MAEEADGGRELKNGEKEKQSAARLLSVYLCPGATQTMRCTHTHTYTKNAKLQLLPGALPPRFVMCQDSGPAEVIESEHGGGVGAEVAGGAAGKATAPSQPEGAGGARSSCGKRLERRLRSASAGKPAAAGAARPRLTSAPVPRRCVFHVSGATSGPAPQPKHP